MIIGIDIGGSTTKIVGIDKGMLLAPLQVKATDPLTSVYGAFGKFLNSNFISLSEIDKIFVTGVGSSFLTAGIYGIDTYKVDEFNAIGLGGMYLSKLDNAVIVSMGTGTAFVHAVKNNISHIGGTGVGGGTLLGLSSKMLNVRSFDDIVMLANDGDLNNVDLTISDISSISVSKRLNAEATASNFGKIKDTATQSDIALGIINMVFQTVGMLAVFASKSCNTANIVLTGNLTTIKQADSVFDNLSKMFDVKFILPDNAIFATALGAALADENNIHSQKL